ncbi:MAG: DUF1080 domain-containing protein, partial [Planctomycetales bacterium]
MTRYFIFAITLLFASSHGYADEGPWVSLFDGKTLEGWVQNNGTATYRVDNEAIVGRTAEGSPNSFLCTEKPYGDFELEFEVKVDNQLNSGVQIRSTNKISQKQDRRVNGPQVEIESSAGGLSGYVYGEATGRGWLTPDQQRKKHEHFKDGKWNKYRIVARGPRIQTWINDQPIDDLTDDGIYKTHPEGFIGLQVHGIGRGTGPYEVSWRNLRLREPAAASAKAKPELQGTIGVSLMTLTNPFFGVIAETIEKEAAKHGYEILLLSADEDAAKQSAQVKDFIVKDVTVIVLAAKDSVAIAPAIREADEAGIPVFTIDNGCAVP